MGQSQICMKHVRLKYLIFLRTLLLGIQWCYLPTAFLMHYDIKKKHTKIMISVHYLCRSHLQLCSDVRSVTRGATSESGLSNHGLPHATLVLACSMETILLYHRVVLLTRRAMACCQLYQVLVL